MAHFNDAKIDDNEFSDIELEVEISYPSGSGEVHLVDEGLIRDARYVRDGHDLVLEAENGSVTIEGYFSSPVAPLITEGNLKLTPKMVQSFLQADPRYANVGSMSDESSVGTFDEVSGEVTITRKDGTVETAGTGTPVFEGDIIETHQSGAANIVFIDETSFAVSEDARVSIDEYVFNPETNEGSTGFSVLKGIFVFTSGLIGREDPDDVTIDTPMGSIGIRGTTIAGDVDSGEITVVEGAIVLRNFDGHEVTLANQFETATFDPEEGTIEILGTISVEDFNTNYGGVSGVSGELFSSVEDTRGEDGPENTQDDAEGNAKESARDVQDEDSGDTADGEEDVQPDLPPEAPQHGENVNEQQNQSQQQQLQLRAEGPVQQQMVSQDSGLSNVQTHADALHAGLTDDLGLEFDSSEPTSGFDPESGEGGSDFIADDDGLDGPSLDNPIFVPEDEPVNRAPELTGYAPDADTAHGYFASTATMDWSYDFKNEFTDSDSHLTYRLSDSTIDTLNNLTTSSELIFSTAVLDATQGDGNGWSFENGVLSLHFRDSIGGGNGWADDFDLRVVASDGSSDVAFEGQFTVYYSNGSLWSSSSDSDGDTYHDDNSHSTITLTGGSLASSSGTGYGEIFLLDRANDIDVTGDHYKIFASGAGSGLNDIEIAASAEGTKVYGGEDTERITIRNADTEVYGVGGDDTFMLDLDDVTATSLDNKVVIDGGKGELSWAQAWARNLPATGTEGDVLQLSDGVFLQEFDFSHVSDQIHNIEVLDLKTSTDLDGESVILSYSDIMSVTDDNNVLVIKAGDNDSITLGGASGLEKQDNTVIYNGDSYDVYTDGTVTLLLDVDPAGTTVTGLP